MEEIHHIKKNKKKSITFLYFSSSFNEHLSGGFEEKAKLKNKAFEQNCT